MGCRGGKNILFPEIALEEDVDINNGLQEEMTEDMREKEKLTREYVLGHGILTEEELEGVNFEAMVEEYDLKEGLEVSLDLRGFILGVKNDFLLEGYALHYQYLLESEPSDNQIDSDDLVNVEVISFQYNPNSYYGTMVFDLEKKKGYFGDCVELLKASALPTDEIDLSDEQVEELRILLIKNHVEEWEERYSYVDESSTGSFWWQLIYELEDGRIFKHSGSNAWPSNYSDVEGEFRAFFNAPS